MGAIPVRNALLPVRLHLVGHAIEEPAHAQHVRVVDRHAPLEVAAGEQAVRPETAAPDRPQLVLLGLALEDAPVGEAVLELVEPHLQVRGRALALGAAERARPVRVQPLEVHRVDRVFVALEPVAGDLREHDLHEAVRPGEGLPGWHQRRRRRPEIRPEETGLRLDRVGLDVHPVLELRLRVGGFLERLLQAPARVVPQPAVVVAAQAAVVDPPIGEVGAAMRAVPVDEAVVPGFVLVENEVLAHEPHGFRRAVVQLRDGGDRHPVAPEQLAHRRAGADLRQSPVLLLAQHGPILPLQAITHNVCHTKASGVDPSPDHDSGAVFRVPGCAVNRGRSLEVSHGSETLHRRPFVLHVQ